MTAAIPLYVIALITLIYLVYRYGRYSPWQDTMIGRGFMLMKTAFLAIVVFALSTRIWPTWYGQDTARVLLVGYADLALIYQTYVVIKFQGGFRRRKPVHIDPVLTPVDAELPKVG